MIALSAVSWRSHDTYQISEWYSEPPLIILGAATLPADQINSFDERAGINEIHNEKFNLCRFNWNHFFRSPSKNQLLSRLFLYTAMLQQKNGTRNTTRRLSWTGKKKINNTKLNSTFCALTMRSTYVACEPVVARSLRAWAVVVMVRRDATGWTTDYAKQVTLSNNPNNTSFRLINIPINST